MKIIIATNNTHKCSEIRAKFNTVKNIEFLSLKEADLNIEIAEDGQTFQENSLKKARTITKLTGEFALADDSGLVVPALDNEPGIYSARYGYPAASNDQQRYELLLKNMQNLSGDRRKAYFFCCIAITTPDGKEYFAEGRCDGEIALAPSGTQGFGYDPVFFLPEYSCTMAEITMEQKNMISHRARALEKAAEIIQAL